jgi:hypothetical protein
MKVWKSVFVAATGSLLLGACTVTVSDDPDAFDDDDDLNIGNPSPFDGGDLGTDPTTEETETEDTEDTETESTSETDAGGDTEESEDAGELPTDTSTVPDASTDDTEEPVVDSGTEDTEDTSEFPDAAPECSLDTFEPPSCEACLQDECGDEYSACECDSDCSVQLATLRSCYAELNTSDAGSLDPEGDWELCLGQAGGDNPSDLLYEVLACAGEPYTSDPANPEEDPYGRVDMDGQCTYACFSLYSFEF